MWEIWSGSGKSEQTMQGIYICFVFIALLKSAATLKPQKFGIMVISREGIHTKTSLKAQLDISSKTKVTKTKPNNLAHSESNLLDETRTTSVLIFVSFTITVLVFNIYLVVYLKNKNGTYTITRRRILKVVRWLRIWILSYIFFSTYVSLLCIIKV